MPALDEEEYPPLNDSPEEQSQIFRKMPINRADLRRIVKASVPVCRADANMTRKHGLKVWPRYLFRPGNNRLDMP